MRWESPTTRTPSANSHDVQTTGQEQLRSAERKIEEQPLMSVAIAFVTGLIVGRLLDRRSSTVRDARI
jgi:ElaB/YqjD/DUF883 family membrane-anchored ribosome-binding protein